MLWRPLRKYIISTFPVKTVFIYYIDLYSGFVFLLVYELSNDKCVCFSGQKITEKWFSHEFLDKKIALNLGCKNKDDDECVCVLWAIASNTLILGWIDTSDDLNSSTCKCWSRAEWRYKMETESNEWIRRRI